MSTYSLPINCPVRWTATQELSLSSDHALPGTSQSAPLKSIYSQFLWLPESIMPLTHLIPSIQRFFFHEGTNTRLEELSSLLLTPRQCSDKYRMTIPRILLSSQLAAGEEDETIMWFAFRNDKPLHDEGEGGEGEADIEDRWRKSWLQRMERREVEIQILFHFFLLQHSRPTPAATVSSPPKAQKNSAQISSVISLEDRLESLMDKFAMWQLITTVDAEQDRRNQINGKGKERLEDDRDWMQRFCEDIIQPAFSKTLPHMFALLHTKVFRHSLFSSDEEDGDPPQTKHPILHQPERPTTNSTRSRSRSLSISLEAERRATSNNTNIAGRKRLLSREVSMSKVFKKAKTQAITPAVIGKKSAVSELETGTGEERGRILVASTPVKDTSNRLQRFGNKQRIKSQEEYVEVRMEMDYNGDEDIFATSTLVKGSGCDGSRLYKAYSVPEENEGDELEDEWMIGSPSLRAASLSSSDPGSPDVLLLQE